MCQACSESCRQEVITWRKLQRNVTCPSNLLPRAIYLLEGNETGAGSSSNTRTTVLDRLVGDGELSQVVGNHLRLDLHLQRGVKAKSQQLLQAATCGCLNRRLCDGKQHMPSSTGDDVYIVHLQLAAHIPDPDASFLLSITGQHYCLCQLVCQNFHFVSSADKGA